MQRLGSLSVLQRLPASSAQFWECQRRHLHRKGRKWCRPPRRTTGPLRNQFPTFEVSNLVLDLDAEGLSGVRNHDSELDGEPETKAEAEERMLRPIKERVAEFEREYEETDARYKSMFADKYHPFHLSDPDFLVAVLLSPSDLQEVTGNSRHASMLDSILYANGIPRTARDYSDVLLQYMSQRRATLFRFLESEDRKADDDKALLRTAIDKCQSFCEIDRLVTRMIRTQHGCRMLPRLSNELYKALTRVPDAHSGHLLSLLNSVVLSMDRYKLQLSAQLYELGIWTSLKCQAIATAQQFMRRRLERGPLDDNFADTVMNELLQNVIASASLNAFQFQPNSSRLGMVFSLLTGYVPGQEQPMASIRSIISPEQPANFRLYLRCLARLGAFRTIWHEWHTFGSKPSGIAVRPPRTAAFSQNGHFITAVLDALTKNIAMADLGKAPEFVNVTGNSWEDCQFDMLSISRGADILALPEKSVEAHPAQGPIYVARWDHLYRVFSEEQIEKAISTLQAFLIRMATSP